MVELQEASLREGGSLTHAQLGVLAASLYRMKRRPQEGWVEAVRGELLVRSGPKGFQPGSDGELALQWVEALASL